MVLVRVLAKVAEEERLLQHVLQLQEKMHVSNLKRQCVQMIEQKPLKTILPISEA
nr:MAG TPA: hypothetical protein [Caudoviricetes sp.]